MGVYDFGSTHMLFFDEYEPIISKIDTKFLSLGLDTSVIQNGFKKFNMSNPKLIKMISHLSPANLRVGGNMADRLIFMPSKNDSNNNLKYSEPNPESSDEYCNYVSTQNFSMYGQDWLMLNNLTRKTNLDMIFDLNALRRLSNDSWDSRNAEVLINFSNKYRLNLDWQLGNEPNSFRHKFNYEVNASQLASDFLKLKKILKKYKRYGSSLLIGPDTTRPDISHKESMKYLEEFLEKGKFAIDIISWHQYYFNGRTANQSNFLDPVIFDILKWQIDVVKFIQKKTNSTSKKIWLGETASAWGGGSPKYSDKFIACFIWLDKLGTAAKNGIDVVVRQSIFNGYYALISDTYEPNPDYWISILFKKLVGTRVISCFNSTGSRVRLYCHCSNNKAQENGFPSITVYGMNMQNTTAKIHIIGLDRDPRTSLKVVSYTISSKGSLLGKNIYLNDKLLKLTSTNDVPHFQPKIVDAKPYVVIPPFSIVFWIIPIKSQICN